MTTDKEQSKACILYVDDDKENLNSFNAVFRRDYDVHLAESGREALEILNRQEIQVLITDQRMPGMNGSELLESVVMQYPDTLRFMLTGFSDFDPLVDAINKGKLQGYFSKPFDVRMIKNQIERGLSNYYLKMENRQLYEALKRSEARFRSTFEQAAVGIAHISPQGYFLMVNKKLCSMLGYAEHELLQQSLDSLLASNQGLWDSAQIKSLLNKQIATMTVEKRFKRRNGEIIWVNLTMSIVSTEQCGFDYITAVIVDITQRKKAQREKSKLEGQLRQAQKMEAIGTLAGGIAHDFNNILSPIIGYAEIILADTPSDGPLHHNVQQILTAGMRARDLINHILVFSRQTEQDRRPLKIQPVIKEALKLLRASIPSTVDIHQNIDDSCGLIMADPTQIYQVVINLCTNAFQAMQSTGGSLEVTLQQFELTTEDQRQFMEAETGHYAKLVVSDSGVGIADEDLGKIFDPYYSTKRKDEGTGGTGLGLSVVHGIIKSYSGFIKVYSELGKGTTFTIYLPLIESDFDSERRAVEEQIQGGSERILVVDDEKQLTDLLVKMLVRLGYRTTAFNSSAQALDYFSQHADDFDLVITDMTMPEKTGLQIAMEIMDLRPQMPIIICTGFSEQINRPKALKTGVREFILKPVIRNELATAIRRSLKN